VAVRVLRSFAFVDLCGFTAYTEREGDQRSTSVLSGFRAALREIASRRGVRVAKWLGDGAMFVSVQTEPLIGALLEIELRVDDRRSPLPIRAGMTTGAVILFEGDDYVGSAVNLAARLCDAAPARQVLATPDVADSCPPWAEARPGGTVPVPGFDEPIGVVRLARRSPGARPVTDPVCGLVLPADGVAVRVAGEVGVTWSFCSSACAASWSGTTPAAEDVLAPG